MSFHPSFLSPSCETEAELENTPALAPILHSYGRALLEHAIQTSGALGGGGGAGVSAPEPKKPKGEFTPPTQVLAGKVEGTRWAVKGALIVDIWQLLNVEVKGKTIYNEMAFAASMSMPNLPSPPLTPSPPSLPHSKLLQII